MDLHHAFNLCYRDVFILVEPANLGSEHLLWPSSSIKIVYREIENDMKLEIDFILICEQN
jgi:hypothetical protein